MKAMISVVDRVNHWVLQLIAVVFGFVSLLTVYQVFARYVLKSPLIWSEELVRYLMIWMVFLGGAVALRKGLLISVEIVQHLVPRPVRKAMEVLTVAVNMAMLAVLIVYGFGIMDNLAGQRTGAMDIPVAWTYAAIPVGSILAFLNSLVVLTEIFSKKERENDGGDLII